MGQAPEPDAGNNVMTGREKRALLCGLGAGVAVLLLSPSRVHSWGCSLAMVPISTASIPPIIFPNWYRVRVGYFQVTLCDNAVCGCAAESIRGVTVFNYGTATGGAGGDITNMYYEGYWWPSKTPASTGLIAMTYAGPWGGREAWTWAGATGDVGGNQVLDIRIYATIAPCPTDGATVQIGFPADYSLNPTWPGSFYDGCGCTVPYVTTMGTTSQQIRYVTKTADKENASPGDTIEYTITYGRPGLNPLASIMVFDTQPSYTHLIWGSAAPPPDPGWDPNPGPPARLRWTRPGGPTTGGPTDSVVFSMTIDWGNGDSFEPGSGDVAAPEGYWLANRAQAFFEGSSCAPTTRVTLPAYTVVRRYIFWMMGDNDLLFAPAVGLPDDEVIYGIFVKNVSSQMTWWDVRIWDTVPPELDIWKPGYGFDDPCVGWTMTPSGCSSAAPGTVLSGGLTILTWKLDMPPGYTIDLKWKAMVRTTASPDTTAINLVSMMAMGKTGVVDGTGHAQAPRNFIHLAPIILRTTYNSYVSWGASGVDNDGALCCDGGIYIHFFPLNKMTNFELRKREYQGTGSCAVGTGNWANDGGVSASINIYGGSCLGGYPDGGTPGCKAERVPSTYWPNQWIGNCPAIPSHFLYKVVSNSPVLWQMMRPIMDDEDLGCTFIPATTNTFSGYMHYTYIRDAPGAPPAAGYGDVLNIVNTDPLLTTTSIIFKWNAATLSYDYQLMADLGVESQWMPYDRTSAGREGYLKILSSDGKAVIRLTTSTNTGDWGTNFPYYAQNAVNPTRDSGLMTSVPGAGPVFYAFLRHSAGWQMTVGNVGATDAVFEVHRYAPDNPVTSGLFPSTLSGTSGSWVKVAEATVPAGLAPPNAYLFGSLYDPSCITSNPYLTLYRVTQKSGGGLQIISGGAYSPRSGGNILHPADGLSGAGTEFWLHTAYCWDEDCGWQCAWCNTSRIFAIDFFAPKSGTAIRMVSNDGYTATYTTTGPDQCIAFRLITTGVGTGRRNWKGNVLTGTPVTALYAFCTWHHKFYTAPFVATGVHYTIIAPPVIVLGQNFWITVVVAESGGGTKTDYTGTSSFTSTDPGALIQSLGMSGYNYTWLPANAGVKIFINVSFSSIGLKTVIASDTMDGSITGLATILVVAADIKLEKRKRLSVAASGDTVQFWICWSNYSSTTGYSFTITDAVPNGTTYVPELAGLAVCGQNGPFDASVSLAASASTTTTPPTNFATVNPGSTAGGTTRWLRWTVRDVYVNSTGCVCFKVSVL